MSKRLRIGDIIDYAIPGASTAYTGAVIGHPYYSTGHEVVVIAPIPAQGAAWQVLNDMWCQPPKGRDVRLAASERRRLVKGVRPGFLQKPRPGWSR